MSSRLPARASRRRVPALTHDPSPLFQPPEVVGPFRVRRVLASGTLGPRLLVEDDRGRLQVLKLITDITDDAPALAGLLDQVRQALPLHAALLPVTEVGASEEGVYLASPVLNAPSVEGRLRGGRQTLEATLPWLRAVTAGLQAAHDAGVWHGAIHPRDVLVTDDGGVLTGVGVAPVLEHLKLQAPGARAVHGPRAGVGTAVGRPCRPVFAGDARPRRTLGPATDRRDDSGVRSLDAGRDPDRGCPPARGVRPRARPRSGSTVRLGRGVAGGAGRTRSGGGVRGAVALCPRRRDSGGPRGSRLAGARDIKVQAIDDHRGDSLSLFPEEGSTVESPVVETSGAPGTDAAALDAASEAEQEWLVADVPDESTSIEPEADPFAIRYAPAPAAPAAARGVPGVESGRAASGRDVAEPTRPWESESEDSPSRRPWLLARGDDRAGRAGIRHVAQPAGTIGADAERGLGAGSGGTATPAEPPPAQAPPPAARPTSPAPPAPKAVPQAPVAARPPAPRTPSCRRRRALSPWPARPRSAGTGRVLIRSSPAGDGARQRRPARRDARRAARPAVRRLRHHDHAARVRARPARGHAARVATGGVPQRGPRAAGRLPGSAPAPTPDARRPAAPDAVAAGRRPPAPSRADGRRRPSRRAEPPLPTGGIFVTSTPTQARLLVDGQPYGSTPAAIPGAHAGRAHRPRGSDRLSRRGRAGGRARRHPRPRAGHVAAGTGMKALLALENGQVFEGVAAGAAGETSGEVVFNTSLTGYQEVLTDPSYSGQIVTMTAPLIGNYGVSAQDGESRGPQVAGFVMREESRVASNWRSESTLREYLVANDIVAISDIDTRALTRLLRSSGVMRGVIATGASVRGEELVEKARAARQMAGADLVKDVTCAAPFDWVPADEPGNARRARSDPRAAAPGRPSAQGGRLRPGHEVQHPAPLRRARRRRARLSGDDAGGRTAEGPPRRRVLQQRPGRSRGAAVRGGQRQGAGRRERAGLRHLPRPPGARAGARRAGPSSSSSATAARNHPVKHLATGAVEITSQNHGFAVDPESIPADVEVTHVNLYDNTVEGLQAHDAARSSACSTTPKPPRVRTTPTICSASSSTPWRRAPRCPAVPTSPACSSSAPVPS